MVKLINGPQFYKNMIKKNINKYRIQYIENYLKHQIKSSTILRKKRPGRY